jgi:L-asparaginase II
MVQPVAMAEVWRGSMLESLHLGHAVLVGGNGAVVQAWGDPAKTIYPRSSCKMIQALPLVESGAVLTTEQLALACASHNGAAIHTDRVTRWLAEIGMAEADLRCGPQEPDDRPERDRLIRAGEAPCQIHNNCSGKHTGFLTLTQRIGAGPDYVAPDHPVQRAVKAAFEEVTGETSPGYGIDGCSAPNFATSLTGLGRAMAAFASATETSPRGTAMVRLRQAMAKHPDLVAGEGRSCTELMRAMEGRVAVKTGAEGVFVAIVPERKLGIALKIEDGATRGAECALTALLCGLGLLDPEHPAARRRMNLVQTNRRGIETGMIRAASELKLAV